MAMPPKYAASRTRDIVQSGEDVRARVRALTLQTLDQGLDLDQIKSVVTEVMDATAETLKKAVPEKQSSALRGVFDGLSDALDEAAKSASHALKDAQAKGDGFKDKTLVKSAKALRSVEEQFLSTVSSTTGKFATTMRSEVQSLVSEARGAGHRIRPHVQEAMKSADGRLLELMSEAATATATVAKKAAAATLGAASGLLQGISDKVSGKKAPASPKKAAKAKKPAKKAAKKPAPKAKKKKR
ncbi:hypothetical protein PHYC_00318 [Phycisphaerales bacterium]|nr:hypothetical protein PHYC_00318 [Phycisphaerales bacterium]